LYVLSYGNGSLYRITRTQSWKMDITLIEYDQSDIMI
jgi:hypothetical protein